MIRNGSVEIRNSRLLASWPAAVHALTWSWRRGGGGVVGGAGGRHRLREQQQQQPARALLAAKRGPQRAPAARHLQAGPARPPEDGGPAADGFPRGALAREQRPDTRPRPVLPRTLGRRHVRRVGDGGWSSNGSRLGLPDEERGGVGGHGEPYDAVGRLRSGAARCRGLHAAERDYRGGRIGRGRGCGAVRWAWPAGTNRWIARHKLRDERNRSGDCTHAIYRQRNLSILLVQKIKMI